MPRPKKNVKKKDAKKIGESKFSPFFNSNQARHGLAGIRESFSKDATSRGVALNVYESGVSVGHVFPGR